MSSKVNGRYARFDDSQNLMQNHTLANESNVNIYKDTDPRKIKNASYFELWKRSFVYLISDIKKKPKSFKIGVFTIILVCAFIVMLDSVMALAPLFLQNPNGDIDVTATVKPPFTSRLVEGDRDFGKSEYFEDLFREGQAAGNVLDEKVPESDEAFEKMVKEFINNPSDFITNVSLVERILLNSSKTSNSIEGVYGRLTLPCRVEVNNRSSPALMLVANTK